MYASECVWVGVYVRCVLSEKFVEPMAFFKVTFCSLRFLLSTGATTRLCCCCCCRLFAIVIVVDCCWLCAFSSLYNKFLPLLFFVSFIYFAFVFALLCFYVSQLVAVVFTYVVVVVIVVYVCVLL